jgi:hypothetical protein
MAGPLYFDRVWESSTTTGTGDIALDGALTGYRTFSSVLNNADTCYYVFADQNGSDWEVGEGTYNSGPNTLTRTTVLSSSNAGNLVNFSAGTKNIYLDLPALAISRFPTLPISVSGNTVSVSSGAYLASGLYHASGVGVQVQSGIGTLISGQTVNVASGTFVSLSGQAVSLASGSYIASGIYHASGVGVVAQSGLGVSVSGQMVDVASGVYGASGVGVVTQSGLGVLISGQTVPLASGHYPASGIYTASGTYTASGVGVTTSVSGNIVSLNSGLGVLISGQTVPVASGAIVASGLNVVAQSGLGVLISGQMVPVASGHFFASGIGVVIQSGTGFVGDVTFASGSYLASGLYTASGVGVNVQSGVGVSISGQRVPIASGHFPASGIYTASGVGVLTQSGIGVLISGQMVPVASGVILASGAYHASGVGVVTELPDPVTLADGIANPTAPAVGAYSLVYDPQTGTWFREACNYEFTLLTSAARTIDTASATITTYQYTAATFFINVTAMTGSQSVRFWVQEQDSVSTNWFFATPTPTNINATGQYLYELGPGATTAPLSGTRWAGRLSRTWRILISVTTADSFTLSVSVSLSAPRGG